MIMLFVLGGGVLNAAQARVGARVARSRRRVASSSHQDLAVVVDLGDSRARAARCAGVGRPESMAVSDA
ncbi:hypothetical protein [Sorangium sp. So ce406]|uniref:hypothetical protein n=1 Tax=Sorangium sp. So ce406 TaxID=3133311 RepID=UPI003F5C069E